MIGSFSMNLIYSFREPVLPLLNIIFLKNTILQVQIEVQIEVKLEKCLRFTEAVTNLYIYTFFARKRQKSEKTIKNVIGTNICITSSYLKISSSDKKP